MDRVHLRLRGQTWWLDYTLDDGRRIRRSLGTRNRKLAELERARLEYQLRSGEHREVEPMAFATFLEGYEAYLKARKTWKSCQNDLSNLKAFLKAQPLKTLEDLTTGRVSFYLTERKTKDELAPRTLNRIREVLHTMASYAVDHGLLKGNPVTRVKRFPEPQPEIRFLKQEEITDLLKKLEGDRLQTIVALLVFAGLRRGEACWLTREDVDLGTRTILVRSKTIDGVFWQPKTRRARRIPISSRLLPILKAQETSRNGSLWAFPSPEGCRWDPDNLTHRFATTMERLELPWRICDLRHTFGSQLAQRGVSDFQIATLLGNSPPIVRRHYARVIPEDLRAEVEF